MFRSQETALAIPALPQVDIYGPVHKGLRFTQCGLLTRMGSVDLLDKTSRQMLLDDLEGLFCMIESHMHHEDRFIHPALERRRAGSSAGLDDAHEAHRRDIIELRALATALESALATSAPAIARRLYQKFSAFVADDFEHMRVEEEVIQPLLEELYSREELLSIEEALVASIPPDVMMAFLRVMVPAICPEERVKLLSKPKAEMPAEVFENVLAVVRLTLSEFEYQDLARRLDQAA
jgi:hemerythrin-like domain-containing protein